ncbi:hypothetical protein U1Q18_028631 [Sarracenia purpurea var. burkii]
MEWRNQTRKLVRNFSNPNYVSFLFSPSEPFSASLISETPNPNLLPTPTSAIYQIRQLHPNPTSHPLSSSISSIGQLPFFSAISSPISQSLISPATYRRSHSVLRPRFRLISVSSSGGSTEFENMAASIDGPDQSKFRVSNVCDFGSNLDLKQIPEIIEIIRSSEDDLEVKLNLMSISLSVESLRGIFRVLNCERISALRFFMWARDKNPNLFYKPDVCSLIIDNCGWLNDYVTMRWLLNDFSLKQICLTEKAFGFLPVLGSSKALLMDPLKRVVGLLNEAGGSCRGSGICGLLKMLSKLNLFEMAKFVIEITEIKASYYNILILEKCRRCCFGEAREMLEEMRQFGCDLDAKTYNYLLSTMCKHDRTAEACSLLEEMSEKGCPPDALTFEIFICSLCRLGNLDAAVKILDEMVGGGIEPRVATHAAIVKGYFYSMQYETAYNYVVSSSVKYKQSSNIIYTLLASLHHRKGDFITAGNILLEMMNKGLIPRFPVYVKIWKWLYKSGRTKLAGDLKSRFYRLRS